MVTAFKTDKHLREIERVPGEIKINCNTGAVMTDKRGKYVGLKVWYIPDGIANIFSMHKLEKTYRITYDSWDGYYKVHTPKAKGCVRFYKDKQGLPFIDLESSRGAVIMLLLCEQEGGETTETVDGTLLVQTAQENFEGCTKREILQAKEAHQAQAMIGGPKKDYKGMVSSNIIKNCQITVSNVTNAQNIFGLDLASIRGKMVQRTPAPVVADYVVVLCLLVEANSIVTLAVDVFFVYRKAFLLTVSRRIKFVRAKHVPVQTAKCLGKHLK